MTAVLYLMFIFLELIQTFIGVAEPRCDLRLCSSLLWTVISTHYIVGEPSSGLLRTRYTTWGPRSRVT
jgi:hypothetical protein